jgi:uncharacterized protein YcgI (DUF1989 family)
MTSSTRLDKSIPAKEYLAFEIKKGETLRVIDVDGKQVADLVAIRSADRSEKLSCVYSNLMNKRWMLTKGDTLFTNRANPMFFILEDKVGLHYTGGGYCTPEINIKRFNDSEMKNCEDNLALAFEPYGVTRYEFNFDCCFNINMNLTYQRDGSMVLEEPFSKPGDYIDLRAEMDCIVAISNCPQDKNPCNAFNPSPLRIQISSNKAMPN